MTVSAPAVHNIKPEATSIEDSGADTDNGKEAKDVLSSPHPLVFQSLRNEVHVVVAILRILWRRTASGSKLHSLPQSNVETYKKLRAADLKYMLPRVLAAKDYQGQEVIGPYQLEGSRIWFGNQYYDSEGDAA
jgi:hypothetical protein